MNDRDPFSNPVILAEVERAMAPYIGVLPDEALAEMRQTLIEALATHPVSASLIKQIEPAKIVAASGEVGPDITEQEKKGARSL